MRDIHTSLSLGVCFGWRPWKQAEDSDGTDNTSDQLAIHLSRELDQEASLMDLDPAAIINESHTRSPRSRAKTVQMRWTQLEEALVALIYGSNRIESAGTSLSLTRTVCRSIFHRRYPDLKPNIAESHPDYQGYLDHLTATGQVADRANVIQARREVISHAKALASIIDHVIVKDKPVSEGLIHGIHRILHDGLDEDVTPGKYRDHEAAVSYGKVGGKRQRSICIRASAVPWYMKEMVEHLNRDIAEAEASGSLDPYTLAARYPYNSS